MEPDLAERFIGDASKQAAVVEITKTISRMGVSENQVDVDSAHGLSPKTSDCEVRSSRWLKVRDSLEGISQQARGEELKYNVLEKEERYIESKSPLSDSVLVFKKTSPHINFSKIFMWDPWNKIGRKSKKEKLRKKNEERTLTLEHRNRSEGPSPILRKINRADSEETGFLHFNTVQQKLTVTGEQDYCEKFQKSVRFQKDVNVVYFAGDQILEQKMEPLKKETEQQERNKELRREVSAETVSGIKFVLRKSQSDYTPGWNKK